MKTKEEKKCKKCGHKKSNHHGWMFPSTSPGCWGCDCDEFEEGD